MVVAAVMLLCAQPLFSQSSSGTWEHVDSGLGMLFHGLSCAGDNSCIYVADSAGWASILRWTRDGGTTWKTYLEDRVDFNKLKYRKLQYKGVAHPDPDVAIVICDSGKIIRTTDGGVRWDTTVLAANFRLITMTSRLKGYIVDAYQHALYITVDGGDNWTLLKVPTIPGFSGSIGIDAISVPEDDVIVLRVVGSGNRWIVRSTDGGLSWQISENIVELRQCSAIYFLDSMNGWACGDDPTGEGDRARDIIATTTDGGMSWSTNLHKWINPAYGLRRIAFIDRDNGLAIGGQGKILRTRDAGESWQQEYAGLDTFDLCTFIHLDYLSSGVAYALTTNSIVLKYEELIGGVNRTIDRSAEAGVELGAQCLRVGESPILHITTIRDGLLKASVVDIAGRTLSTVERRMAGRDELITLPPPDMPALYFVVTTINDRVVSSLPLLITP
jgi:photosystem II stability/assembly factor-like uncharacterized protein